MIVIFKIFFNEKKCFLEWTPRSKKNKTNGKDKKRGLVPTLF
jgi:hypothetical protein